ncbi:MAG TPA: ester cyclase [Gemmatimonadaceae bacterium]|jgi:steroid delta-isomerase-like uncharacterized protein|nr:ester cyclase [Gemmatimonadaceae bacterium]
MESSEREQTRPTSTRERGVARESGAAADNARLGRKIYEEIWNQRDFDALMRSATNDCEVTAIPFDQTLRGQSGYRQWGESWATAFPDGRVEIKRVMATDDAVVLEFIGRGTHTGPLSTPSGTIPPTGKTVELQLCDVLEIRDGGVRRARSYFDAATLMRQLGI